MLSPVVTPPTLVTGERMSVAEFLRRGAEIPDLKNAELIDGVVYVPSPVSHEHGRIDTLIHLWLAYYAQATLGCEAGNNSTWLMLGSAPQPDAYLRILPSHGGVYAAKASSADGIARSQVFPGLWLDLAAFWTGDGAKMPAALNAGLASEEHQRFGERLASAK